jgi:hypothetical protein
MENTPLISEPHLKPMPRSFEEWQVRYLRRTNPIIIWVMAIALVVLTVRFINTELKYEGYYEQIPEYLLLWSALYLGIVTMLDFLIGLPWFVNHYLSSTTDAPKKISKNSFDQISTELVFTFIRLNWSRIAWLCILIFILAFTFLIGVTEAEGFVIAFVYILYITFLIWFLFPSIGLLASGFPRFPWPSVIVLFCWTIPGLALIIPASMGLTSLLGDVIMMRLGKVGVSYLLDIGRQTSAYRYAKYAFFDQGQVMLTIKFLLLLLFINVSFALGLFFLKRRLSKR